MEKDKIQAALSNLRDNVSQWEVLIVDDEPDNLGVAQRILTFQGATVHLAEDGAKALEKLETVTPSFILLDISMPVMNGWETIQKIRENDKLKHLPVIALTAHAMHGDKEKMLASGFDGYIAKPFRLKSFFQQIMDCLQDIETKLSENS